MPNYSITINSRFRPFSYQELLAPVLASTQEQQQIEENYANLATQASLAGSKANEQTDPITYARYKAYSDALNAMAEDLAKNGLTPESRRSMFNMRTRYAKDIVPIEIAYANKVAQIQQQQQAKLRDPTLLLDRDASTTSLDAYLENPNLGYNSYSGALLAQQVSNAISALAKDAQESEEGRIRLKQLFPNQYLMIKSNGFRASDVFAAIAGDPNANRMLTGVVENVINASGIKKWATGETLADAYGAARMGLYSGVGETTYSNITDAAGMAALQHMYRQQEAATEHQYRMQEKALERMGTGELSYRILSDVSSGDTNINELNKDLNWLNQIEERGGWNKNTVQREARGQYARQDATSRVNPRDPYAKIINGSNTNNTSGKESIYANNYSRIAQRYGLDGNNYSKENIQKLKQLVQRDINNGIVRNNTYKVNITDSSDIAQVLYENSQTVYSGRGNSTGFTNYEKGKMKKRLSSDDVAKIAKDGDDFSFDYKPNVGFILNYRLDGKTKAAVVDPSLLGYGERYSNDTRGHKYITTLLNNNRYEEAAEEIDGMMNDLYYMFNTRRIKQSNTGEVK